MDCIVRGGKGNFREEKGKKIDINHVRMIEVIALYDQISGSKR